eukprot:gene17296-19027_t
MESIEFRRDKFDLYERRRKMTLVIPSNYDDNDDDSDSDDDEFPNHFSNAFEKFLFESMALSTKLDDIRRRLLQEDFAIDVTGIREQIKQNQHVKKWIVKAPIEILEEESFKVVKIIKDSCNCENEADLSDEGRNAVHQARSMMETLFNQRATLKELWQGRKTRLDQCLQFNIFKQDAEKMLAWIQENRTEYLLNYTDIGEDLETIDEIIEEHKQFEANCVEVQANIDSITRVAERLHQVEFYDGEVIDALIQKLDNEWKKLYMAVEKRSALLVSSYSFHKSSDEMLYCCPQLQTGALGFDVATVFLYLVSSRRWMDQLLEFDQQEFETLDEGRELLFTHGRLKDEMSQAYNITSEEGKDLLSALQKPIVDERSAKARSRVSDYSEAVSHVMDIILEMHEQNRQLTILWEKQRVVLSQKYKLCEFKKDSAEPHSRETTLTSSLSMS